MEISTGTESKVWMWVNTCTYHTKIPKNHTLKSYAWVCLKVATKLTTCIHVDQLLRMVLLDKADQEGTRTPGGMLNQNGFLQLIKH